MHAHNISALSTDPQASIKQEHLNKLLKGKESHQWDNINSNGFGHLLPNGISKNWTENEKNKKDRNDISNSKAQCTQRAKSYLWKLHL